MPELPEVETVARALRAAVLGDRIAAVVHASRRVGTGNPRGWRHQVRGQTIAAVRRRGKYLILDLSPDHLVLHLRMTGRLRLRPATAPREPHDRCILALMGAGRSRIRHLVLVDTRQFARIDFCPSGTWSLHRGLSQLGPEATEISVPQLMDLVARSKRPIKSFLLDQHLLAGLGNVYADESLFRAGIHPITPCNRLTAERLAGLRHAIRHVLREAIRACGTTFDTFSDLSGRAGGFASRLLVYGRTGEACHRCRHAIERIVVAGRGTHFCPRCQPI